MNKEHLSELIIYFYRGLKPQCVRLIMNNYNMTTEEAKTWCQQHIFPELEAIQDMKSKLSRAK